MNQQLILSQCIAKGFTILPKSYPTIYDRHDQKSDFMWGLLLGIKKIDKRLSETKIVEYLIRNALLHVKAKAFKAMRKALVIRCKCGRLLSKRFDSFKQIKPCHGTRQEISTHLFVISETCMGVSLERGGG